MILVITSKMDGHVGSVARHLDAASVRWVRLNIEDLATNAELTISPTRGAGSIRLRDSERVFDLSEVTAVWYRKPEPVHLEHLALNPAANDYVEAEYTEIVHGLYALLDHAHWINDPFRTRTAHRKMLQLREASTLGFTTPRTLVTNRADRALAFAEEIGADLAIKSLGAISVEQDHGDHVMQYGIFTRRITHAELSAAADSVPVMPTLFQEFIRKRCELRITCVGNEVFACRIEPRQEDLTADDYRFDTKNLTHTAIVCPELHDRLHAYMRRFDLNFGCFDILVTDTGEQIFCECNPNGQWLWVENLVGLPISEAIARQLMKAGI